MRTRSGVVGAIAAVVLTFALAACDLGADDPPDPDPTSQTSQDRGPAVEPRVELLSDLAARAAPPELGLGTETVLVDLAAARAATGQAEDADPTDVMGAAGSGEYRLARADVAFPFVMDPVIGKALDAGAADAAAAASGLFDRRLQLVHTDQDFEELAAALEAAGFERKGDVLSYTGKDTRYRQVFHVAGAHGFVAFSADRRQGAATVRAAVGRTAPGGGGELGSLVTDLLAGTDAVGLAVLTDNRGSAFDCLETIAALTSFKDGDGELVFVPRAGAPPVELVLDETELFGSALGLYRFGVPEETDGWLRVDVRIESELSAYGLLDFGGSGYPPEALAKCP